MEYCFAPACQLPLENALTYQQGPDRAFTINATGAVQSVDKGAKLTVSRGTIEKDHANADLLASLQA